RIVGALLSVRGRIGLLLRIKEVFDGRLQRLVVSRQRTVLQSRRHPDPTHARRQQNEGGASRQRLVSFGALIRPVTGGLRVREVGSVDAGPFLLLLVPPDELLAFAPGLAVRTRGRAVIEDAAVRRPGESPAVPVDSGRLPAVGPVPSRLGK